MAENSCRLIRLIEFTFVIHLPKCWTNFYCEYQEVCCAAFVWLTVSDRYQWQWNMPLRDPFPIPNPLKHTHLPNYFLATDNAIYTHMKHIYKHKHFTYTRCTYRTLTTKQTKQNNDFVAKSFVLKLQHHTKESVGKSTWNKPFH